MLAVFSYRPQEALPPTLTTSTIDLEDRTVHDDQGQPRRKSGQTTLYEDNFICKENPLVVLAIHDIEQMLDFRKCRRV